LPRTAFFALRDIPPHQELCYDYGYADVPGKTIPCLCGAPNCKKLLY
jgi:SET domain-containing protein